MLGTFNKCCVCLDLRTGSFVIGYLLLIGRVLQLIFSCIRLAGIQTALAGHSQVLYFQDLEFFKLIFSLEILIQVFELLINVALVNGLHKKIQEQVQMYYVGGFVFLVLRLIITSIIILRYAHTMKKLYSEWQWLTFAVEILANVLYVYFLLAIRSYYYEMRKEANNDQWNVFRNTPVQIQINK